MHSSVFLASIGSFEDVNFLNWPSYYILNIAALARVSKDGEYVNNVNSIHYRVPDVFCHKCAVVTSRVRFSLS